MGDIYSLGTNNNASKNSSDNEFSNFLKTPILNLRNNNTKQEVKADNAPSKRVNYPLRNKDQSVMAYPTKKEPYRLPIISPGKTVGPTAGFTQPLVNLVTEGQNKIVGILNGINVSNQVAGDKTVRTGVDVVNATPSVFKRASENPLKFINDTKSYVKQKIQKTLNTSEPKQKSGPVFSNGITSGSYDLDRESKKYLKTVESVQNQRGGSEATGKVINDMVSVAGNIKDIKGLIKNGKKAIDFLRTTKAINSFKKAEITTPLIFKSNNTINIGSKK